MAKSAREYFKASKGESRAMGTHAVNVKDMKRTYTHFAKAKDDPTKTVMVTVEELVYQHDIYRPKDDKDSYYHRGARIAKPT